MKKTLISSGGPWEDRAGYSRAVRVGNLIAIAGTTAIRANGEIEGPGDAYRQSVATLRQIESALQQAGAAMSDVIRTRMFVRNIDDWPDVTRAHNEFFREVRPAATLVEVSRFIHPDILVEIEADAFAGAGNP